MKRSIGIPFAMAGDVRLVAGGELDRAKVMNVLLVEPGELAWRTAFGTPLDALRHRPMDVVQAELVRVRCEDALSTWLPSLEVDVASTANEETVVVLGIAVGSHRDRLEVRR